MSESSGRSLRLGAAAGVAGTSGCPAALLAAVSAAVLAARAASRSTTFIFRRPGERFASGGLDLAPADAGATMPRPAAGGNRDAPVPAQPGKRALSAGF